MLVLGGLVAAGVFGIDTRRTLAFQIFALLFSLLVLSIVTAMTFRSRFRVHRLLPEFGTVNQPLTYRVIVENLSHRPQASLRLLEELRTRLPAYNEFKAARDPSKERRNWFDRYVGYPRWLELVHRNRGAAIQPIDLDVLAPREAIEARIGLTPVRRGYLEFSRSVIARPDPFGLFNAFYATENVQSLLVLPKRYSAPPIQLPGKRAYQHGGISLTVSVGDSQEFTSLRDYRPGDPLRRIHWRSYAKLGQPIVKEYQDEFFVRYGLVLDTFLQEAHEEVFEEAVSVAASIACAGRSQDSLLDLMFIGTDAHLFSSGRGLGGTDHMLEVLACVRPCREKSFSALRQLVFKHATKASGFIFILINWDWERQEFIRQIRLAGLPILVLIVAQSNDAETLDPGPMRQVPEQFCVLEVGKIEEGLGHLQQSPIH
ncbi:MAG: DUF58 domain-containing protein [Gammaproteobacteria bacterium]|nr:DUF58 domain-containing protein [Gammaproteobacteria bacterium]